MWHDNAPSAYLVLALGNWLGGVTKVTKLRPLQCHSVINIIVICSKHLSLCTRHI
jgi:hypothetical protein